MHVLILGAGGVGGYFGARLIEAGADVTFLVRARRQQQLAADGLMVRSALGDFDGEVRSVLAAEDAPPADVVLLACKAYDLASAIDAVAPAAHAGTAVLPLLNGYAHLDTIAARLPDAAVWGGVAHIGVTLGSDGTVRHLDRLHMIRFGAREGRSDPRAAALAALLASRAVDVQASPRIEQDLWDKFVFLATFAGMTCLMRAGIGAILATPTGEAAILALLAECRQIAAAEGFAPDAAALAGYRAQLIAPGSKATSSMLRDIERGGPIEGDHIIGDMWRRGQRHGIATPMLDVALAHAAAYEVRRLAAPA